MNLQTLPGLFISHGSPLLALNPEQVGPALMVKVMGFYNTTVGNYPYKQYSFIQGGDGGMEYAMCTLMLGNGSFEGISGTAAHELAHSWFQHILASNESKHPWMDEGFTSFIEDLALNEFSEKKVANPFKGSYMAYAKLVESGKEQPQSTHGDRYDENRSYSISSYVKGSIFLSQLGYLIGEDKLKETLHRYYTDFKFKHPTPNDIKRSAERVTGANLDWYLLDWTETTNTIDYGIKEVKDNAANTTVTLERIGRMPMPIDVLVEYADGTSESFYIPLRLMSFEKENPTPAIKRTVLNDWAWAYPTFEFSIAKPKASIKKITLDPSGLMADVKLENNSYLAK